jgi:hypothetical protein
MTQTPFIHFPFHVLPELIFPFLPDHVLIEKISLLDKKSKKLVNQILLERDPILLNLSTAKWLHVFLQKLKNKTYPTDLIPKFNINRISNRQNLSARSRAALITYFLTEHDFITEKSLGFLILAGTVDDLLPLVIPTIIAYIPNSFSVLSRMFEQTDQLLIQRRTLNNLTEQNLLINSLSLFSTQIPALQTNPLQIIARLNICMAIIESPWPQKILSAAKTTLQTLVPFLERSDLLQIWKNNTKLYLYQNIETTRPACTILTALCAGATPEQFNQLWHQSFRDFIFYPQAKTSAAKKLFTQTLQTALSPYLKIEQITQILSLISINPDDPQYRPISIPILKIIAPYLNHQERLNLWDFYLNDFLNHNIFNDLSGWDDSDTAENPDPLNVLMTIAPYFKNHTLNISTPNIWDHFCQKLFDFWNLNICYFSQITFIDLWPLQQDPRADGHPAYKNFLGLLTPHLNSEQYFLKAQKWGIILLQDPKAKRTQYYFSEFLLNILVPCLNLEQTHEIGYQLLGILQHPKTLSAQYFFAVRALINLMPYLTSPHAQAISNHLILLNHSKINPEQNIQLFCALGPYLNRTQMPELWEICINMIKNSDDWNYNPPYEHSDTYRHNIKHLASLIPYFLNTDLLIYWHTYTNFLINQALNNAYDLKLNQISISVLNILTPYLHYLDQHYISTLYPLLKKLFETLPNHSLYDHLMINILKATIAHFDAQDIKNFSLLFEWLAIWETQHGLHASIQYIDIIKLQNQYLAGTIEPSKRLQLDIFNELMTYVELENSQPQGSKTAHHALSTISAHSILNVFELFKHDPDAIKFSFFSEAELTQVQETLQTKYLNPTRFSHA